MKKGNLAAMITFLTVSVLVLGACTAAQKPVPSPGITVTPGITAAPGATVPPGGVSFNSYATSPPENTPVPPSGDVITANPSNAGVDRGTSEYIRDRIKKEVDGVEDVYVLVMGNTAVVGYRPAAGADNDDTNRWISACVRRADPSITDVRVSRDSNTYSRIQELFGNVTRNEGVEDIEDAFTRLVNDIQEAITR